MLCCKVLRGIHLCGTACAVLFSLLSSSAYGAGQAADICEIIPGGEIAAAVAGKIIETKSLDNRCVYIVGFKGADPPGRTFVIYQHEARDYDGLRDAMDGEITHLEGIGDEAVMSFDGEAGRYWLLVVKRGQVTYQVSGDNEDMVRKIGVAAVRKVVP
jgi:hypothetical protein